MEAIDRRKGQGKTANTLKTQKEQQLDKENSKIEKAEKERPISDNGKNNTTKRFKL